jgi:hypothetical protein
MKITPRLQMNSLRVRIYNIAGNRVNDKILKVWNATMNHVPTSTFAELLAENACLVEQTRHSQIT